MTQLDRPIIINVESGWRTAFRFWNGLPPDATPDPLTACTAVITLNPYDGGDQIELTTGQIDVTPGVVTVDVSRAVTATWPLGNYDLLVRVIDPASDADRYVLRSDPNLSPVKVVRDTKVLP